MSDSARQVCSLSNIKREMSPRNTTMQNLSTNFDPLTIRKDRTKWARLKLRSQVTGEMTLVAFDDITELSCNHNNCPLYPYRAGSCTEFLPCSKAEAFNTSFPIKKGTNVKFYFVLEATEKLYSIVVSISSTYLLKNEVYLKIDT